MTHLSPNAPLTERIEEQLAEAGLQVAVESSDGSLILSGVVDTEEAREAAFDIVTMAAPNARIDNQIEVETVLPTDVDHFAGDEPSAEMAESSADIRASGGEIEPDFMRPAALTDPLDAAGASSSESEDIAQSGEVYSPPIDPVVRSDAHGNTQMLGGFGEDDQDETVELSSDGVAGDEALADAVRRELAEDSATTELNILVAVRRGVAHLRGEVPDLDDADNAESVAGRVPGIREVVEELDVINV
jgi:osmotically-inducible protein OsmY